MYLQAHESIMDLPLANRWGEKHKLFIDWKYIEAKVYISFPTSISVSASSIPFCNIGYIFLVHTYQLLHNIMQVSYYFRLLPTISMV